MQNKLEVPKPAEKHVYCGVCEVNYPNYLEHIQSPIHKKMVDAQPLYRQIDELIEEFNIKHQELAAKEKESKVSSTKSNRIMKVKRITAQVEPVNLKQVMVFQDVSQTLENVKQLTATTASQTNLAHNI